MGKDSKPKDAKGKDAKGKGKQAAGSSGGDDGGSKGGKGKGGKSADGLGTCTYVKGTACSSWKYCAQGFLLKLEWKLTWLGRDLAEVAVLWLAVVGHASRVFGPVKSGSDKDRD